MRAHDQEFTEFFSARFDWARRIAFALCGSWPEAEEIAQAAFVRMYPRWPRIRDTTVDAYLRTVLTRVFFDSRRRGRAREQAFAELPDQAVAPDHSSDDRDAIHAALMTVPPRQRAVLVLRFIADMSVEQVATTLGCSTGNVKSQSARGLVTLRASYDPAMTRTP
ncbi:SigE family RNA polymerase sigma factor [Actinophytocola sediminis]